MKYYISDLHLFHFNSIMFDKRKFDTLDEMHNTIVNNWNNTITNSDEVYVLGDIAMGKPREELINLIANLKGHKYLIVGNHDKISDYRYTKLFEKVIGYLEITDNINGKAYKVVLSHYPIMMWNGQHRGAIHLYGHVHNSVEDNLYKEYLKQLNNSKVFIEDNTQALAINVGCMQPYMDYTPRTLKELISLDTTKQIC